MNAPETDHRAAGDSEQQDKGYPAEKARQGRIVLRTRAQRAIFIAGLAGAVLLALAAVILGYR